MIPKAVREQQNLHINSKVEIIQSKSGILLIPIRGKLSDFAGMFGKDGVRNIKELDAVTSELLAGI